LICVYPKSPNACFINAGPYGGGPYAWLKAAGVHYPDSRTLAPASRLPYLCQMEQDPKAPKLTGTAKLDATTDAAYEIIDKLDLERDQKTARLRSVRLQGHRKQKV